MCDGLTKACVNVLAADAQSSCIARPSTGMIWIWVLVLDVKTISLPIFNCSPYNPEINTLRLGQNGRLFSDNNFKHISLNENVRISIKISLKFVPKDPINNIPALFQMMGWHRPGDKPLSEPMMVRLLTRMHLYVSLGLDELADQV